MLSPPPVFGIGHGHGTQVRIAGVSAGGAAPVSPVVGAGQIGEAHATPSRGSRGQRDVPPGSSPAEHTSAGVFSGHRGAGGSTVAQALESLQVGSGLIVALLQAVLRNSRSQELPAAPVAVGAAMWLTLAPPLAA